MNEVQTKQITISSLEIAEMLEIKHADLLKKLEGTKKPDGAVKQIGIIPVLNQGNFPVVDYFIKDTYKDAKGEERPCYQFTKLGCDFIANKFTGEKGIIFTAKYVRKFNEMAESLKDQSVNQIQYKISFTEIVQSIDIVASSLKVNDASKILMYDKLYSSYGVSTEFLPKYEDNGSREIRPATTLLKMIGSDMKTATFNQLLLKHGYLEERNRKSSKSDELRYFKALTEKGLEYGENLINPRNQKEVQPYYYVDTFKELYDLVTEEVGVLA